MKTTTRVLDLEEQLYADTDGTLKKTILADLSGMQLRLQGDLRKLNSPGTHRELQGALQAVTAALQVMRTLRVR